MTAPLRLHAAVHGAGHAPWLVFLHGFLGDGHDWDGILGAFRPRYSCVCIDLPGHGGSRIEAPCSHTAIVAAVHAVLDEYRIGRCSLIGYSMGGRVALRVAADRPHRVGRLVLESAAPGLRSPEERDARRVLDGAWVARLEAGGMRAFIDAWYAQPLFATIRSEPARFAALCAIRAHQDPCQLALGLRSMGPGVWPSAWEAWEDPSLPALLIAGEHDAKYAALAREMAAVRSGTHVRVIPGCGHNVHWEDPAAYTAAVTAFLMNE